MSLCSITGPTASMRQSQTCVYLVDLTKYTYVWDCFLEAVGPLMLQTFWGVRSEVGSVSWHTACKTRTPFDRRLRDMTSVFDISVRVSSWPFDISLWSHQLRCHNCIMAWLPHIHAHTSEMNAYDIAACILSPCVRVVALLSERFACSPSPSLESTRALAVRAVEFEAVCGRSKFPVAPSPTSIS